MPHFYRVLEIVKNKKYVVLLFDKQVLTVMPHPGKYRIGCSL